MNKVLSGGIRLTDLSIQPAYLRLYLAVFEIE
jgi:hypothetical protein